MNNWTQNGLVMLVFIWTFMRLPSGNHGGDHAHHLENYWDIGDPGVRLATLGCAQRVGERDKKEPATSSTSPTHSRKESMIEELQAG